MTKDPEGVIIRQSRHSVKMTIDLLQDLLLKRGVKIYARINQQSEAEAAEVELAPLEFILFGNPVAGGKLMKRNPLIALDLPLKIIAYQDADLNVWVAYNSADYINSRYSLGEDPHPPLVLDQLVERIIH